MRELLLANLSKLKKQRKNKMLSNQIRIICPVCGNVMKEVIEASDKTLPPITYYCVNCEKNRK